MDSTKILVTGGAGYIGSHIVLALRENGYTPIILDDLSSGHAKLVQEEKLVQGDIADQALVCALIKEHDIKTVLHLAAFISVPESVAHPEIYWENNVEKTKSLLSSCQSAGVQNIIFSSSAAVYGPSEKMEVDEESPLNPINPYGETKLAGEELIKKSGLNYVMLRYFNVAGCDPQGRTGQMNDTHSLIRNVVEASLGEQNRFEIFGTNYATKDGTAVRDFIHVTDLAQAHIAALKYIQKNGPSVTLNCGYGKGYSVRDVIAMSEKVTNQTLDIVESAPREGDCPALITKTDKIKNLLEWEPRYDDLEVIIRTTYEWLKKRQTTKPHHDE